MTDLFKQLENEVELALEEIHELVQKVQGIADGTSDAQVQPVLDKLHAAVTTAKIALASSVVEAPTPAVATPPVPEVAPVAAEPVTQ